MARQPFGQIPAIDDDGFAMYESRAIARYIDGKAGDKLTPHGPEARARRWSSWISVETEDFTPHAMKFIYHDVFKRAQTPEVLEAATQKLEHVLRRARQGLAGKKFFTGDQFTIADIGTRRTSSTR